MVSTIKGSPLQQKKRSKERSVQNFSKNSMAFLNQLKHTSTCKILWITLTLFINSCWPLLFILLSFLSSSLFYICYYYSTKPILRDLIYNFSLFSHANPKRPEFGQCLGAILRNLREITIIESAFLITAFFLSALLMTVIIHIFSMACTEKQPTFQELLSRTRSTWKRSTVTKFYVTVLNLTTGLLMLFLVGGFALISTDSMGFLVVSGALAFVALLVYLYLAMIWSVSLVVAVVEDGFYGLSAIVRAAGLVPGRRRQGVVIALLLALVLSLVSAVYVYKMLHGHPSDMKRLGAGIIYTGVAAIVNVLVIAVSTVFYHECRQSSHGGMMLSQGGNVYSGLPSGTLGDAAIP